VVNSVANSMTSEAKNSHTPSFAFVIPLCVSALSIVIGVELMKILGVKMTGESLSHGKFNSTK